MVGRDEAQIRFRRLVDLPSHLFEVLQTNIGGVRVAHAHRRHHVALDVVVARHLELAQKTFGHGHQGLLGPGQEPVDGAAVDERGELADAVAER